MITIFTGKPGNGKTAHVVDQLSRINGRPIFVMGIPELKIEHQPVPPVSEWTVEQISPEDPSVKLPYFTFPPGALVVLDEAQRIYRPRSAGSKVPDIVAAFETHRHTGIDFWLITQDPLLLDSNIRKLVTRHIHIRVTAFGRFMYEWPELGDPENRSSRDIAKRDRYRLPQKAFKLYKSSELHTRTKVGLPWYFWIFVFSSLLAVGVSYYVFGRISSNVTADKPADLLPKELIQHSNSGSTNSKGQGPKTATQLALEQQPRIDGLMHTAPMYDELTAPQVVPEPVGCVATAKLCKCLTQQGTRYETTDSTCRQWVKDGFFFKHWKKPEIQLAALDQGKNDQSSLSGGGRQPAAGQRDNQKPLTLRPSPPDTASREEIIQRAIARPVALAGVPQPPRLTSQGIVE